MTRDSTAVFCPFTTYLVSAVTAEFACAAGDKGSVRGDVCAVYVDTCPLTDPPPHRGRVPPSPGVTVLRAPQQEPTQDVSDHAASAAWPVQDRGRRHSAHLASSGDSAIRWKVLSARTMSMPFSLLVLSTISLHGDESTTCR